MEIVKATEDHLPEILVLWQEFIHYHRDISDYRPPPENVQALMEDHLKELLVSDNALVLIARENEQPIGYSIARVEQGPPVRGDRLFGFIDEMGVNAGYRHRGAGEMMLDEIRDWFRSQGIERIELYVLVGNEIGDAFWKKHGFQDFMHRLYLDCR
jgi:ribosomal protein S18 acetylase RimI-like enzyme